MIIKLTDLIVLFLFVITVHCLKVNESLALRGSSNIRLSSRKINQIVPPSGDNKSTENASILDNLDYILRGYNAAYGNPHDNKVDPGFKNLIFKASYSQNKVTGDLKFRILDGTDMARVDSCETSAVAHSIAGAASYHSALAVDAAVEGGIGLYAFQANSAFKQLTEETKNNLSEFLEEKADCKVYKVTMNEINSPLLTQDFLDSIKALPMPYAKTNAEKWHRFLFKSYGTHCVFSAIMGARYGLLKKFTKSANLQSKDVSTSVGGGASSFGTFKGKVQVSSLSKSNTSSKDSEQSTRIFSIGSSPGENIKEWLKNLNTQMPISYELYPLNSCMEFPKIEEQLKTNKLDPSAIVSNIKAAIENYCQDYLLPNKQVSSCDAPKDPVVPPIEIVPIEDGKTYRIRNEETGMCVQFNGKKNPITMYKCEDDNSKQMWILRYILNVGDYSIVAKDDTRLVWDIAEESKEDNGRIHSWKNLDKFNQQFYFGLKKQTGTYKIKSRFSNKCLQVEEASAVNGARVVQFTCSDSFNQRWKFKRTDK